MRINSVTTAKAVVKSDDFEESTFKIQADAAAFKVLSNDLYANKIRAVIREVSCNAADSHVAAGVNRPFEVSLPTQWALEFTVQDFGTGLSHADIMHVYTTYFQSTKRADNKTTGGFGLGSKSPFAYTNEFTVTSVFEGRRRVYSAALGPSGAPSITLLGVSETDDSSGLTVSFAVRPHDVEAFTVEARRVFEAFKKRPEIVRGDSIPDNNSEIVFEGPGWQLNKNASSVIRMGNVDYPFPEEILQKYSQLLRRVGTGIVLEQPVGALLPTPSRESLTLCAPSAAALCKDLDQILATLNEKVELELNNCPNLWEARFKADLLLRELGLNDLATTRKYKGVDIDQAYTVRHPATLDKITLNRSGTRDVCSVRHIRWGYRPSRGDRFIIAKPDDKKYADRIRQWILTNKPQFGRSEVYVYRPSTEAELQAFLDWLGLPEDQFVGLSSLPPVKASKKRIHCKGPNQADAYRIVPGKSEAWRSWSEAPALDLSKESGYYVTISRWKIAANETASTLSPNDLVIRLRDFDKLRKLVKLPRIEMTSVVGVKTAQLEKFEKSPNWKPLIPELKSTLDAVSQNPVYCGYVENDTVIKATLADANISVYKDIQRASGLPMPLVSAAIAASDTLSNSEARECVRVQAGLKQFLAYYPKNSGVSSCVDAELDAIANLKNAYPMLHMYLDRLYQPVWRNLTLDTQKIILDYVKLVS